MYTVTVYLVTVYLVTVYPLRVYPARDHMGRRDGAVFGVGRKSRSRRRDLFTAAQKWLWCPCPYRTAEADPVSTLPATGASIQAARAARSFADLARGDVRTTADPLLPLSDHVEERAPGQIAAGFPEVTL